MELEFYPEKINPFDELPEIDKDDIKGRWEAKQRPRIYITEEKTTEPIGVKESLIYTSLQIRKQPVTAMTEDGQKVKIWDLENKAYTFFLDDKNNPVKLLEVTRERVMEYYTVITRGHAATIFKWQNRKEAWLKYDPTTPGIRVIGTYISIGSAVRKIQSMAYGYRILYKSCVDFKSYDLKICQKAIHVINPENGEIVETTILSNDQD